MAVKKDEIVKKKEPTKIRQKIIVENGGKMNSDEPISVVHIEYVESAPLAKQRVQELRAEYPNSSISYFSV